MNVNLDRVRDDLTKVNAEIADSEQMLTSLTAQLALLQGKKTDLETFLRMADEYRQGTGHQPAAPARQPAAPQPASPQAAARTRLIVRAIEQSPTPEPPEQPPPAEQSAEQPPPAEQSAEQPPPAEQSAEQPPPAEQEERRVRLPPSTPMILKRIPDRRQTKIALRLAQSFGPDDAITAVDAQSKLGSILDNRSSVTRVHYVSSFLAREADAKNGVLQRLEPGKYKLRPDVDLADLIAPQSQQTAPEAEQASSSA